MKQTKQESEASPQTRTRLRCPLSCRTIALQALLVWGRLEARAIAGRFRWMSADVLEVPVTSVQHALLELESLGLVSRASNLARTRGTPTQFEITDSGRLLALVDRAAVLSFMGLSPNPDGWETPVGSRERKAGK